MHYNFARIHKTLPVTPAMAAGVTGELWSVEDIAVMVDAAAPKPGRPTGNKKRGADGCRDFKLAHYPGDLVIDFPRPPALSPRPISTTFRSLSR